MRIRIRVGIGVLACFLASYHARPAEAGFLIPRNSHESKVSEGGGESDAGGGEGGEPSGRPAREKRPGFFSFLGRAFSKARESAKTVEQEAAEKTDGNAVDVESDGAREKRNRHFNLFGFMFGGGKQPEAKPDIEREVRENRKRPPDMVLMKAASESRESLKSTSKNCGN